jgi:[1-hydroxy-2-(trimethylamino)ethyl]phosphonate dioxygenase
MRTLDLLTDLFARAGSMSYFGEPVSQLEHALQTAHLAERAGSSPALITAALLHDIGHLLHGLGESIAEQQMDGLHEAVGAAWLERHFGPEVSVPVRLHVAAKRYLCAVEPAYAAALSPASQRSLQLQGGPLSPEEQRRFQENPHATAAISLRRWDDEAKLPGRQVAEWEHYRPILLRTLKDE